MALRDLINSVVGIARNGPVGTLRATVYHNTEISRTAYEVTVGNPVERKALIEEVSETVTMADGTDRSTRTKLTFLEPVVVIDNVDTFTLPDGIEYPVLKHAAMLDPDGLPYQTVVYLGYSMYQGGRR